MPTFNTTPNHKIVLNYFFIMHRVASNCQALVQILRERSTVASYKTPSNKIYEFVK